VVFLDTEDDLKKNLDKITNSGHSRFPVCKGSPDVILGILQVKDLFAQGQCGQALDLVSVLKPAEFVPDNMPALELLEHLRERKNHLALVIDEFGGVSGMVTINDLLEAIVGDIPTLEDKIEDPQVVQREDGSYLLDGMLSTEELKDLLRLAELPNEAEASYETLGGMIMTEMERIPDTGDVIDWNSWRFEVVDMDGYRVDKVLASRVQETTSKTSKQTS
jgi:putative hemolysin